MSQQFCLKWNNHTTNMLQVFESLLSTEALVDVTLACDGLSLKAHKMVLSACSPFFQSLFLENPCKHPIVIMKDMRYCDLKAIIDFMYRGEVNVSHDQLSALLKTAETLKVKGLAEVTGENRHASGIVQQEITQQQQQSAVSTPTPTPLTPTAQRTDTPPLTGKRKRGRPRKRSLSDSNRSDDEGVAAKIKDRDSPDVEELSGDASMDATSDIRSGGGPGSSNSQSQVPTQLSSNNVNSFSKSHLSITQDSQVDDTASGDENEFEVEPSKLLEQTLTTDNVPSSSQNSTGHIQLPSVSGLEISRRSMSSTDSLSQALVPASDSLGSNLQAPDSPQDIKPQILSFDDPPISPVAGPSHSSERSMMMYMDQSGVASIPGPSNYQDNSALVPHDSQPQDIKLKIPKSIFIKQECICCKEESLLPNNKILSAGLGTVCSCSEEKVPDSKSSQIVQISGSKSRRKNKLQNKKIPATTKCSVAIKVLDIKSPCTDQVSDSVSSEKENRLRDNATPTINKCAADVELPPALHSYSQCSVLLYDNVRQMNIEMPQLNLFDNDSDCIDRTSSICSEENPPTIEATKQITNIRGSQRVSSNDVSKPKRKYFTHKRHKRNLEQYRFRNHFPTYNPPSKKKLHPAKQCAVCPARSETTFMCKKCGNIPLHVKDCFLKFHIAKYPKSGLKYQNKINELAKTSATTSTQSAKNKQKIKVFAKKLLKRTRVVKQQMKSNKMRVIRKYSIASTSKSKEKSEKEPTLKKKCRLKLTVKHLPEFIPPSEKKQHPYKQCKICPRRNETTYMCRECGNVPLHKEGCFEKYHRLKSRQS